MALLSLRDVRLTLGGPPLLDGVSLNIEEGERVCLLGRNGAGKSTLLKMIGGEIAPDSGELALQKGAVVRHEQQRGHSARQKLFQPRDGGDVEMVRRLV